MSTSYSTNLALALPATGELSGTWGTTVNTNITNMLDEALGYQAYSATGGADTITIPDGTTGVARSIYIQLNGTGGGSVAVPATKTKMYFVFNNTASAITFKVTGQTGVSIPAAAKMALVSNGTDVIVAQNYFAALTLGAALPVASGGTGLTAGTSGGVLAYTATGTLASSTALAASALVIGGGAGAAPSTTTTGTGVVTALGVNTGTAGAFVVNGGALGSPSSVGTMPAFTLGGTIAGGGNQINNVVIGTTTPLAGAFTTLSATVNPGAVVDVTLATFTNSYSSAVGGSAQVAFSSRGYANTLFGQNGDGGTHTYGGALDTFLINTYTSNTADGHLKLGSNNTVIADISSTGLAVTGTLSTTSAITATSVPAGPMADLKLYGNNSNNNTDQSSIRFYDQGANNTARITSQRGANGNEGKLQSYVLTGGVETKITELTGTGLAVTGTLSATGLITSTFDGAGNPWLSRTGATTNAQFFGIGNTGGIVYAGIEASVGGTLITGATGYAFVFRSPSTPIQFSANGGTSPQMTLDSSGNLGIGLSNPSQLLSLYKATGGVKIHLDRATNTQENSILLNLAGANQWQFGTGVSAAGSDFEFYDYSGTAGTRLIIKQGGNVGIGTNLPTVILETSGATLPIFNTTAVSQRVLIQETNDGNSNCGIAINKKHSTLHPAGHWYGDIKFNGWDGSAFVAAALIEAVAEGTPAASNMPGNLRFSTNGGSAGTTERVRISSDGTFRVKGAGTAGSTDAFQVAGTAPADAARIDSSGNLTISNGNLIVGTAGKGIDFSATSSGSGTMTSELLADYEEGTWVPTAGSGLTVTGTFVSSGTYTKVGRLVTVNFAISATLLVCSNSTQLIAGLPFSHAADGIGSNGVLVNATPNTMFGLNVYGSAVTLVDSNLSSGNAYGSFTYPT